MDVPDEWGTEMKDTIYRDDAIKAINLRARIPHDVASAHYANMAINAIRSVPSADRPSVDKDYLISLIQEAVYDGEACARLMDIVDRPQGDVDAVAIFEREMHNLEQGYITIGEFDDRIEPLRHLCYGRPQGHWINADTVVTVMLYDEEHEEYHTERMTIAECLSRYTEEGCPWKGADDE